MEAGDGWKCIHGLVGQGPGWGPGEVSSPTAPQAPGFSSPGDFLNHSRSECQAGLPVRVYTHTNTHTHTPWQDNAPYAHVHKIFTVKADVV